MKGSWDWEKRTDQRKWHGLKQTWYILYRLFGTCLFGSVFCLMGILYYIMTGIMILDLFVICDV